MQYAACCRRGCVLAVAMSVVWVMSCATTSSTESSDEKEVDSRSPSVVVGVDEPIAPWILNRRMGLVLRVLPNRIGELPEVLRSRLTVEEANPAGEAGASDDGLSDGERFYRRLSQWWDAPGLEEWVALDRPIWFALESRRPSAAWTCQKLNLPCAVLGGVDHRYWHMFIPTTESSEIREQIRRDEGFDSRRFEVVGEWVHLVGVYGGSVGAEESGLESRKGEMEKGTRRSEVTPAMATAFNSETPLAGWAHLRSMTDFGVYQGHTEVVETLPDVEDDKMRGLLYGTLLAGGPMEVDLSATTETTDVGVRVVGDGERAGELQFVATQTPYGRAFAKANKPDVSLPAPTLGSPDISFQWGYNVPALRKTIRRDVRQPTFWVVKKILQGGATFSAISTFLRMPRTIVDYLLTSADDEDPTPFGIWGAIQMDQSKGRMRVDRSSLEVALSTQVARDEDAENIYSRLANSAEKRRRLHVSREIVEEGTSEREVWRGSWNRSIEKGFGESQHLDALLSASFTPKSAVRLLSSVNRKYGMRATYVTRMLARFGLDDRRFDVAIRERERVSSGSLALGGGTNGGMDIHDTDFELDQPRRRCMTRVGHRIRDMLADAFRDDATVVEAARERFDEFRSTFDERMKRCVEEGRIDEAESTRGLGFYDAFQAMLAVRTGNRERATTLLERACGRNLEWACDTEIGSEWPWKMPSGPSEDESSGTPSSSKPTSDGESEEDAPAGSSDEESATEETSDSN